MPTDLHQTTPEPSQTVLTDAEAMEEIANILRSPNLLADPHIYIESIRGVAARTGRDLSPMYGVYREAERYEFLQPDGTWSHTEADALRLNHETAQKLAAAHDGADVMALESIF